MARDEAAKNGRGARRAARVLAFVLIAGGLASAVPGIGLAKVLGAVTGYADFGYVPQQCAQPTSQARAINGDVVRVCQETKGTTSALLVGHDAYPFAGSDIELHVALPDAKLHFNWYMSDSDATGTWRTFGPSTFDPVVVGNPMTGVARFTGSNGGTTYLQVAQTARVNAGASSYTLTYAVTNASGSAQTIRPLVNATSYGWDPPHWTTSAGPRRVTQTSPNMGGSLSLTEGTPAVAGYAAGGYSRVEPYFAPHAPALPNTVVDDPTNASEMALAWAPVTLAAGATQNYSVTVALQQPRELLLTPRDAAPAPGAAVLVDARISDDRPVVGRFVRWSSGGRNAATGSAAIGADNRALLTFPAAEGPRYVRAYVDNDGDGREDDDEAVQFGQIFTPRGVPTPAPTPAVPAPPVVNIPRIAVPAPTVPSVATLPFKRTLKVKKSLRAKACRGSLTLELRNGTRVLDKRTVKLSRKCALKASFRVQRTLIGSGTKLTVVIKGKGRLKTTRVTIRV